MSNSIPASNNGNPFRIDPLAESQSGNPSGQGDEMHESHEAWLAELARKAGELPFKDVSQMTTADRLPGGQAAKVDTSKATQSGLNDEMARLEAAARFRLGL